MDSWIKQQWDKYHPEIIGGIILTIILSIGAALWAMAQSWAGPLIIPLGIGILALGLLATNQFHIIWERNRRSITSKNDEQIKKTLEEWLLKQGHSVREDPQSDTLFQFGATNLQGKMVIISKHKNLPNLIRIWVHFKIPKYALDRFNALPEYIREEIMQQCQIEMARQGVQWEGLSNPLGDVKLHYFMLCDDSLTEFNFLNGVVFMVNSQVLLHATMALLIKQAERNIEQTNQSAPDTKAPPNL